MVQFIETEDLGLLPFEDGVSDDDIVLELNRLRSMPVVDPMGPFGAGLQSSASAIDAVLARSFYGIGLDETAKRYEDSAREREEDISLNFRPEVGRFSDIDEARDIPEYIWNLIGQSAPETGVGLGGAAVGAILGSMIMPGPGTAAGALIASGIGGTAAVTPFFAGRNIQAQAEDQGIPLKETDLAKASAFAVAQGSLDALLNTFLVSKIIPVGVATRVLGQEGKKGLRKIAGRLIVGAMRGAAIEAPTELSQEFLEMVQAGEWDGLSEEDKARLTEVAIGAGILGGLLGGAGNLIPGRARGPADVGPQPHAEVKPAGAEDEKDIPLGLPSPVTPLLPAPSTIYAEGEGLQPQVQTELDFAASDIAAGEFEARATPEGFQFFRARGEGEQVLPIRVATEEEAIATIDRLNQQLEAQREAQRRTQELSQAGAETTRGGIAPVELEGPEPTLRQDEIRRIKERRQAELNQLQTAAAARQTQGRDTSDLDVEIQRRQAEISAPVAPEELRQVLGSEAVERVRLAQMPLTGGTGVITQPGMPATPTPPSIPQVPAGAAPSAAQPGQAPEVGTPEVRASEFQVAAGRARLAASDQVARGRPPIVPELDLLQEIRQSTGVLDNRAREILQELQQQTVITREGQDFRVDVGPRQPEPVQSELAEPRYEVAEQAARAQGDQREGYGVFREGRAVTPLFPTRKEAVAAQRELGLPASSVQGARSIYALVQRDPETGRVTDPINTFDTRQEAERGLRDLRAEQPLPPVAGPGIPIRTTPGTPAGAASPQAPQVAGAASPGAPARPPRRRVQSPLLRDLRQFLDTFGLSDVNLQLMPQIPGDTDPEGLFIARGVSRVIQLATRGQTKEQLADVMKHEIIHALRAMDGGAVGLFTAPEWQAMVNYATKTDRPKADGTPSNKTFLEEVQERYRNEGLNPVEMQEEAVAEAFRFWARDRVRAPGRVGAIFRKIVRFFSGLADLFQKNGAVTPEQVFEAITTGEVGRRFEGRPTAPVRRQSARQIDQLYPAGDFRGRAIPKNIIGKVPSARYSLRRPPNPVARKNAEAYKEAAGIKKRAPRKYIAPNVGYLEKLSNYFDAAEHDPSDPQVNASYDAFIRETIAQYGFMPEMTVEPWYGEGEPYANSAEAMADIANGHLYFFLTDNGYGEGENNAGHPMLEPSGIRASDGRPLLNNDIFRITHDYFGHSPRGVTFSGEGEYNAYLEHSRMYSDAALPALAGEALMQNSWFNLGPHMRRPDGTFPQSGDPDFIPPRERPFAEQKAIFVPDHLLEADPNAKKYSLRPNEAYFPNKEGLAQGEANLENRRINLAAIPGFPAIENYLPERLKIELFGWPHGTHDAVNRATKMVKYIETLPSPQVIAGTAIAGRAKRGWYEKAAEAIVHLFGVDDGMRFAALLAALSPQTSVESNLENALNVWLAWKGMTPEGRNDPSPTEDQGNPEVIKRILGERVQRRDLSLYTVKDLHARIDTINQEVPPGERIRKQGGKQALITGIENFKNRSQEHADIVNKHSVLDAWQANVIRALTAETGFQALNLSGPKVASFGRDVIGGSQQIMAELGKAVEEFVWEVTLDTWMAYQQGYTADELSGLAAPKNIYPGREEAYFGQMSPTYAAGVARNAQAAEIATNLTGEKWTASEIQESAWSLAKTLVEMWLSRGPNLRHRGIGDFLMAGGVRHKDIIATPDFATLMVDKFYKLLEKSQYGDDIKDLRSALATGSVGTGTGPAIRRAENVFRAEDIALDQGTFGEYLLETASIIEQNYGKKKASLRLSSRDEITIEEIAGNKDPYSRAGLAHYAPVFSYFDDEAIEVAVNQAADPMSRSFMAVMPPDMFLALASVGAQEGVSGVYAENFDRGMKSDGIPFLKVNDQGVVTGHEGRHRSQALSKLGEPYIPVMITTELREARLAPRITPQMGAADPSLSLPMPDNILNPRTHQGNLDLFNLIMTGDEYPAVRATLGLAPTVDRLNELGEIIKNEGRGKFASGALRNADPTTPASREAQYTMAIEEMLQPMARAAKETGALRTYSTPGFGMWGGFKETSTSFEAVYPPDTDLRQLNPLAVETFELAKLNNQEDAFLAVDMGPEYTGPDARPGITVFFYRPMTQDNLDAYIEDLQPLKNVGGFTAIQAEGMSATFADQPGKSPRYTGLRFIWAPEYAEVQPEDVQASFDALDEEFKTIKKRTAAAGMGSVNASKYTALLAWKENYDDTITALRAAVIPELPSPELWRKPVAEVVAKRLEDRQRTKETNDSVRVNGANAEQAEASARLASEGDATTKKSYRAPIEDDAYLPKEGPDGNVVRAWLPFDTEDTADGIDVPIYLTHGHEETTPEGATSGHGIRHLQKHDVDFIAHTQFKTAEEAVTKGLEYIRERGADAPGVKIWRGQQNWTQDPDTDEKINLPYWDHFVEWTPKGTNSPVLMLIRALRKQMETRKGRVFRPTRGRHPVTEELVTIHHVVTAYPSGVDARLSKYGTTQIKSQDEIGFVRKDRRPILKMKSIREHGPLYDPLLEQTTFGKRAAKVLFGALDGETLSEAIRRNIFKSVRRTFLLDEQANDGLIPVDGTSAGKAMEIATQLPGRLAHMLQTGAPTAKILTVGENMVRDLEIGVDTSVPGLMEIFKNLGSVDVRSFHLYAIALRERRLRLPRPGYPNGRPGIPELSRDQINQYIADGEANPKIVETYKLFQKFNDKVLTFAASSGLYDSSAIDELRDMMYVPFYRALQAKEGRDPGNSRLMLNAFNDPQSAIDQELGSSDLQIKDDLFDNLLGNYSSIMSAALKNNALHKTAKAIDKLPPETGNDIGWRVTGKDANGPHIMTFREDGEVVHYKIKDLALWSAISSLSPQQRSAWVTAGSEFAAVLRAGITRMPGFMLANLIRGKITAYVTTGAPLNFGKTLRATADAYRGHQDLIDMQMASGIGGYTYGVGETQFAREMNRTLRRQDGSAGFLQKAYDRTMWGMKHLDKMGEATEMAERLVVYRMLRERGATKNEAAYHAMNVINFSRKGAGQGVIPDLVMNLTPMVPFLNARLQGLYRLQEKQSWHGTAAEQNKRKLFLPIQTLQRGMLITGASLAMYAMAVQDDRWDEETLERKLLYNIFYTPSGAVYIPRAFEVGALFGALPVMFLDAIRRKDGTQLRDGVIATLLNTFAFNPIPQAALPVLETVVNFDFFTGSPIENIGISRLQSQDRATSRTSSLAKIISRNMGGVLSPLQIDHLITGYTGGMGALGLATTDAVLGVSGAVPSKPHGSFGDPYTTKLAMDALGAGRFYRSDDERASQFSRDFYDMKRGADQAQASLKEAFLRGDTKTAQRILDTKRRGLSARLTLGRIARNLSDVNRMMRAIREDPNLSGSDKRKRLSPLTKQKKALTRQAATWGRKMGL